MMTEKGENVMWENLWPRGACLLLGYALGSVMTAELAARIAAGKSIREIGNGNPGFANVLLHLGKPAGTAVLAGDVLKTAMACWLCTALFPSLKGIAILYAGLGAVLGHDFPPRGQGGKGVTVTCTWLTLCLPVSGALCCLAGGALTLALGYLPVGAVFIAVTAVPLGWVQYGREHVAVLLVSALVMLSRHYRGLLRVLHGTEPRYFAGKEK